MTKFIIVFRNIRMWLDQPLDWNWERGYWFIFGMVVGALACALLGCAPEVVAPLPPLPTQAPPVQVTSPPVILTPSVTILPPSYTANYTGPSENWTESGNLTQGSYYTGPLAAPGIPGTPPKTTPPAPVPPAPPAPVYQSITFPAPAGTTEHYLSVARTLKAGEVITGTFTITDTAEPSKYHESNSATATWYVEAIEASGMRVLIRHDGNAETTLELGLDVVVPFDSTYIVKVGVVSRRAKTVNIKILPAGWQTREVW